MTVIELVLFIGVLSFAVWFVEEIHKNKPRKKVYKEDSLLK